MREDLDPQGSSLPIVSTGVSFVSLRQTITRPDAQSPPIPSSPWQVIPVPRKPWARGSRCDLAARSCIIARPRDVVAMRLRQHPAFLLPGGILPQTKCNNSTIPCTHPAISSSRRGSHRSRAHRHTRSLSAASDATSDTAKIQLNSGRLEARKSRSATTLRL